MSSMSLRANLLAGIAVLALAVMQTLTGQSLAGYGKTADRADDPKRFWGSVAICYVIGLFFIGRYLYQLF
jgi:hypothetical protein